MRILLTFCLLHLAFGLQAQPFRSIMVDTNGQVVYPAGLTLGGAATNFGAITAETLFVTPDGNDSTGSRTDPNQTYQTPNGAQADALPGDTVVILPGFYSATNLGANYVNWHLHEGVTLTGGSNTVFQLNDVTCWITGTGAITNENPTLSILSAYDSDLRLECRWRGTFDFAGGGNTVTFRDAVIYSADGMWLSGDASTTVTFDRTSALNYPVTDCTLTGELTVDTSLTP